MLVLVILKIQKNTRKILGTDCNSLVKNRQIIKKGRFKLTIRQLNKFNSAATNKNE